jgi:hypothetical protein
MDMIKNLIQIFLNMIILLKLLKPNIPHKDKEQIIYLAIKKKWWSKTGQKNNKEKILKVQLNY